MTYLGGLEIDLTAWIIIPLLIFLARILDVSIGTIKIIFISRGVKFAASLLAFVEVLIWLVVLMHVMQNLTNPINFLAYAAGFAMGTYVGITIENRLAVGVVMIEIITKKDPNNLVNFLEESGYRTTQLNASGDKQPVNIVFTVVKRKNIRKVVDQIKKFNPSAFYSIKDVDYVSEILPLLQDRKKNILYRFRRVRKAK